MTASGDADPGPGGEHHELSALVFRLTGDHAALAGRVTDLEDRVEEIAGTFDEIEATLDTAPPTSAAAELSDPGRAPSTAPDQVADAAAGEVEVGLDMRRLIGWVRDNVALLLERKVPQTGGYPYWCRKWWCHPEAIARFEAARRSWAEAVTAGDGNAMVVYFEHLDHQLGVLCAENGPFCGCKGGEHRDGAGARPLGHDDPDESYFIEFEQAHDHPDTR